MRQHFDIWHSLSEQPHLRRLCQVFDVAENLLLQMHSSCIQVPKLCQKSSIALQLTSGQVADPLRADSKNKITIIQELVYPFHLFIKTLQMPAAFDACFSCSRVYEVAKVKQHRAETMLTIRGLQKARQQAAEV